MLIRLAIVMPWGLVWSLMRDCAADHSLTVVEFVVRCHEIMWHRSAGHVLRLTSLTSDVDTCRLRLTSMTRHLTSSGQDARWRRRWPIASPETSQMTWPAVNDAALMSRWRHNDIRTRVIYHYDSKLRRTQDCRRPPTNLTASDSVCIDRGLS